MRLSRPRAALLDWDNTLVDSFRVIHTALNDALEAMGRAPWTFDDTCLHIGRSMHDFFPAMFGQRWREARDIFYRSYAAHHLEQVRPLPGSDALLAAFSESGVYLAVVSNKTGDYLRREVDHLGWGHHFGRVVGANDAPEDKPAPTAVSFALDGSGIAAGRDVWFVGDNAIDVDCAEASGCVPVLMKGAVNTGVEIGPDRAPWRFDDCAQLAALVQRLG